MHNPEPKESTMPESTVYIAEEIWFGETPVDGRKRIAVCTSLDDAVTALREDDSDCPDLVATEVTDSALGSGTTRTWAVHERGAEPDDEGHLWITSEQVVRSETSPDDPQDVPDEILDTAWRAELARRSPEASPALIEEYCDFDTHPSLRDHREELRPVLAAVLPEIERRVREQAFRDAADLLDSKPLHCEEHGSVTCTKCPVGADHLRVEADRLARGEAR
jgi:hypothetical protein